MSAVVSVPMVNGFAPSLPTSINEVQEYQKILKLRDEVFAGTHPRLTLSAHAIKKVSPSSAVQLSSASHTNVPPPFSSSQQSQLPGLSLNNEDKTQKEPFQKPTELVTVAQSKPTASGIDPVLLIKSDDLIRAETNIHRQRLEKALKDQFEQKRLDARKRPAIGESKPDFDVTAVLAKALEVVKPEHVVKVTSLKDDASVSESYDENSLYSSRAPDSTPEAGELDDSASPQNRDSFADGFGANGAAEVQASSSQHVPTAVPPHQVVPKSGHDQLPSPSARAYPIKNSRGIPPPVDLTTVDNDDEDEEGEYSPPEAMDQSGNSQNATAQIIDPRSRPLRRYSELEDNGRKPGSSYEGNMRIVRNHITSPIAPQPSRVSPLAVAKESMILQNARGRNGRNQRGRDDSPDGPSQGLPPRKKRKLERKAEKRRRLGKGSPDIKDEPVSPPPFHDVQPLGSSKLRPTTDNRPIVLEDTPSQEIRYIRAPERYVESPTRPMARYVEPMMPPSDPRTISRASMRPPPDNTDLRRVASMHNMRESREHVEQAYESPNRARAASYMRVDSPMRIEPPRLVQVTPAAYEREPVPPQRVSRTPAPTYREVYPEPTPEIRYVPEPMPPPPIERIVIDQYGRRFREIIQQDRASVAPRAVSNYPEREQPSYYETYDRPRAGSVMVEAPDPRYTHEMPPPRMARPVAEANPVRRELYEPLATGRSASVVPTDHLVRQPVYVDERGEFREPTRMGSVRPQAAHYEEQAPVQMMARTPNGRQAVREGSVFVEDRPQVRREYLPMEPPQYRVMEPAPRYVDAQGREIISLDGPQDGGQRYVQRY